MHKNLSLPFLQYGKVSGVLVLVPNLGQLLGHRIILKGNKFAVVTI